MSTLNNNDETLGAREIENIVYDCIKKDLKVKLYVNKDFSYDDKSISIGISIYLGKLKISEDLKTIYF